MNILVIGGTGMLAEACIKLSEQADFLVVVARAQSRLDSLGQKLLEDCEYFGISADWNDSEELKANLTKLNIKFDMIVAWIHSDAQAAHKVAAGFCKPSAEYFDITSHSGLKPEHITHYRKIDILDIAPKLKYRRVVLGSKDGRWLTNYEISKGLIEATNIKKDIYVVGEVFN